MDSNKNLGNSNNDKKNSNRPIKTGWLIWIYLIVFYTYSFIIYSGEQKVIKEEQLKEEANKVIEFETTEFELKLKEVINNQEVWRTYTVDVIDGRESSGVYWLDNSKTEGYIIKLMFEDDGSVRVEEWTDEKIRARHLARLTGGSISIKDYSEIVEDTEGGDEIEQKETKEAIENK